MNLAIQSSSHFNGSLTAILHARPRGVSAQYVYRSIHVGMIAVTTMLTGERRLALDKESLARLLFLLDEQPNSGAGIRMNCSWQQLKSWNRAQYERLADAILAVRLDEAAIRKDEREKCAALARNAICDGEWPPADGDVLIDRLQAAIRNGGKQP